MATPQTPVLRMATEVDSGMGRVSQAGALIKTGTLRAPQPRRVFGKFALVYLLEGSGVYVDVHRPPQLVEPGTLIVVFPDLAHGYGPRRGERWHEFYLVFEGPVFEQWQRAGWLNPMEPVWRLPGVNLWKKRMMSVIEPGADLSPAAALTEVSRLQQLLADMISARQPRRSTWLLRAIEALEQEPTPEDAAGAMDCSYATFRRRFTSLQGVSPGRFRLQRRIEEACRLMHESDLNDKQIAANLGFCDEFHFSRTFKRQAGLSPREYRRGLP